MESDTILAFPKNSIPKEWMPVSGFVIPSDLEWLQFLSEVPPCWHARVSIENNIEFKQPIPYVIIRNHKGEYATYLRKGSEVRLQGLLSAGIGGHVEWKDCVRVGNSTWGILQQAMGRELKEEILLNVGECGIWPRFVGVINEELTSTGKVHWGIVFLIDLPEGISLVPQQELHCFSWQTIHSISSTPAEHWTLLALSLIQRTYLQQEGRQVISVKNERLPT
jgi:predicted NUDIX family phosphoesterase